MNAVEARDLFRLYASPQGTSVALQGLSLDVAERELLVVFGPSGSGKSTIIGLVMAFNHPKSGRVVIDGRDLATVRLRDYRSNLGIVLQENFLFDGTIAENIRYGRPDATMDEVRDRMGLR